MNAPQQKRLSPRWITVVLYALGMAWLESATVYYLRTMIHRVEPYQPIFCGALFLMAAPVIHLTWRIWSPRSSNHGIVDFEERFSC